jgi:hypothetical protein
MLKANDIKIGKGKRLILYINKNEESLIFKGSIKYPEEDIKDL